MHFPMNNPIAYGFHTLVYEYLDKCDSFQGCARLSYVNLHL